MLDKGGGGGWKFMLFSEVFCRWLLKFLLEEICAEKEVRMISGD